MIVLDVSYRCNPVNRHISRAPKANVSYVAMASPSCTSVMGWRPTFPVLQSRLQILQFATARGWGAFHCNLSFNDNDMCLNLALDGAIAEPLADFRSR
jgi:hypothetical protein